MHIVEPYAKIISISGGTGAELLRLIEKAARTCYKSEGKQTGNSYKTLLPKLLASGHMSVFEHGSITVEFCVDRGVSHELVRHRLMSYSQESTRYCSYNQERFGKEIKVIKPIGLTDSQFLSWSNTAHTGESGYFALLDSGCSPSIARDVLPNCLATTVVVSGNPRAWRHLLLQRTTSAVHPKFLQVSIPLLGEFQREIPILYDDIQAGASPAENHGKAQ
jgi:thymidylate synthase (FAD)